MTYRVSLYKAIPPGEYVKSGVLKKVGADDKGGRIAGERELLL